MNKQIKIDLIIDGKNAVATIKNADAVTKALGKQAQTTSTKLSNIGNIATGINSSMSIVQGFVGTVGNVVGKYTEFESGIKNVNTLLRVEDSQLETMEDRLISISKDTGEGLRKLADATYQAVSAGYSMSEALDLVEISSKASVAGLTDTEVAVDGITTVLNAFHMSASEGEKAADLMFKTVERGKTTFPELASNLSKVASLAYSSGISFDEISAATATLTKQGTPTSEAMTQIKASIVSMNKVLGDGWADSMTYQEGLQAIADKANGSQNELKKLLGTDEAVSAALKLTGDNAQMASDDLDSMATSLGAMNEAFEIQSESIEFKTKRIAAAWDVLTVSLIDNFAPAISWTMENFTEGLDKVIKGFNNADIEWYKFVNPLWVASDILGEISDLEEDIVVSQETINNWTENLKGTTKEYRDEELKILSAKWDIIDAQILSGELEGVSLSTAKNELELLKQQALVIQNFGKKKPDKPTTTTTTTTITGKSDSEKETEKAIKAAQKLDDAKEKYFLAELNRQEKLVFEETASTLSLEEINKALLQEKTSNSEIAMNLKDAETQKAFEQLKSDKDISDTKIEILKDEQAKALAERGNYWESVQFINEEYMSVQLQQIQNEYNAQVQAGVDEQDAYAQMIENKKTIDEQYIEWLSEQDEIMRQIKSDYFSEVTFMDDDYLQKQLQDIQTLYEKRVASGIAEKDAHAAMIAEKEQLEKSYYDYKWSQIQKDNALFDGALKAMDRGYDRFISSLTSSAMTGSERMNMVWENMKQVFVQTIGEMVKAWIVEKISAAVFGASMQATEIGKAVVTGSSIAMAYAPAASMVSLATFGSNSLAAMSGITATSALATSLASIPAFEKGVRNLDKDTFALVGEKGPEFVRLPKGSDVYNNDETKIINQMLEEEKRSENKLFENTSNLSNISNEENRVDKTNITTLENSKNISDEKSISNIENISSNNRKSESEIINQMLEEEKRNSALPMFIDERGELNNYASAPLSNTKDVTEIVSETNIVNNQISNTVLNSQVNSSASTPLSNHIDITPLLDKIQEQTDIIVEQTERLEAVERTLNIVELDDHLSNYKMEQGEIGNE